MHNQLLPTAIKRNKNKNLLLPPSRTAAGSSASVWLRVLRDRARRKRESHRHHRNQNFFLNHSVPSVSINRSGIRRTRINTVDSTSLIG